VGCQIWAEIIIRDYGVETNPVIVEKIYFPSATILMLKTFPPNIPRGENVSNVAPPPTAHNASSLSPLVEAESE
jgi:hypothetical protein